MGERKHIYVGYLILQSSQSIWMEFDMLFKLVGAMNLILIWSRPIGIQGRELYQCYFFHQKKKKKKSTPQTNKKQKKYQWIKTNKTETLTPRYDISGRISF